MLHNRNKLQFDTYFKSYDYPKSAGICRIIMLVWDHCIYSK